VALVKFPVRQMHRIAYTKLTKTQIFDKLRAAANGPSSASPSSDVYTGKQFKIVTDNGPTLGYRFAGNNRLEVSENGGTAAQAGYGALTLGDIVFFTHLIPGTQRGYHVVVDQHTNLATVFEVWFSGYKDNREVQRQAYYGYVEQPGKEPPKGRHTVTNRAEGKGYYWKQDNGIETLEFYPSTAYSHFVELTRLGGELGFSAASDYVLVNDNVCIYQRTECEFSGIQTIYAFDANRVEQIGARLGFNEKDELEYYVFRGHGEWLGQLAHFEKFGDVGLPPKNAPAPAKGARRVYRPMQTFRTFTRPEFDKIAAQHPARVFPDGAGAMAGNKLEVSNYLVGKAMTIRYDHGPAIEYHFDEIHSLRWRKQGAPQWTTARYESWESAPNLIMFAHLLEGEPDHDCHVVVADFDYSLASCLHGTIGSPYIGNEAQVENLFGVIERENIPAPKYMRHQFTDELVGKAITWNYSTETGLTSMHLYSTPHTLSWIIFGQDGAGGLEWCGPAAYVKIRGGIYLGYWLEEACNGTLGTILVNLNTMHDCGAAYNGGANGINLSAVGAHARLAGQFNVAKYYQPGRERISL
jgi:MoaF N-terminal domain/MoaF C-terminal domain